MKTMKDPKKVEFVLGYLEGQGERFGQNWRISEGRLHDAFKKLAIGRETNASIYRQVGASDVSKIKKSIENPLGSLPKPTSPSKPTNLPKLTSLSPIKKPPLMPPHK